MGEHQLQAKPTRNGNAWLLKETASYGQVQIITQPDGKPAKAHYLYPRKDPKDYRFAEVKAKMNQYIIRVRNNTTTIFQVKKINTETGGIQLRTCTEQPRELAKAIQFAERRSQLNPIRGPAYAAPITKSQGSKESNKENHPKPGKENKTPPKMEPQGGNKFHKVIDGKVFTNKGRYIQYMNEKHA